MLSLHVETGVGLPTISPDTTGTRPMHKAKKVAHVAHIVPAWKIKQQPVAVMQEAMPCTQRFGLMQNAAQKPLYNDSPGTYPFDS